MSYFLASWKYLTGPSANVKAQSHLIAHASYRARPQNFPLLSLLQSHSATQGAGYTTLLLILTANNNTMGI